LPGKQTIGQDSSGWRCRARGSEGEPRKCVVRRAVYIPPKQQSPITSPQSRDLATVKKKICRTRR